MIINNFYGKGFGDNGKAIANKVLERGLNIDIVWLLRKDLEQEKSLPVGVRFSYVSSLKSYYEMATAKVWIENCRKDARILKRKSQFYIQTWHGGLGLKKIEGDAENSLPKKYIKNAKKDTKNTDLFISNSQYLTDLYRNAFWHDGDILESGCAKNDVLFTDKSEFRKKIRDYYKLDKDIKICLYAPTFRQDHNLECYRINSNSIINELRKMFGGDWNFMVRLHPNISSLPFDDYLHYDVNASAYEDMQELVMGVDALITDYSSCMFDSAMAKIPTFLYATDIEEYTKDRGFYFQLDELPFSVSENSQELVTNISKFNQDKYLDDLNQFYEKVGLVEDGKASDRIVDVIEQVVAGTYPR